MRFDLHTHSSVSDGTEPPEQVVAAAAGAGLSGIALTDHDTTAGWTAAAEAAEQRGITLLPGMEITAKTENGISVHMLSYLHNPDFAPLVDAVTASRGDRLDRARRICERLSADIPLTWADVEKQVSPGATIGRPHLADALVAVGAVGDRSEAFATFLHPGTKYYIGTENITPTETIRLVRAAGGVPVIAHAMAPARGRTVNPAQLEAMVEAGLGGVEVWHRDNTQEGKELLLDLAVRHDLIVTGSSDYHGTGKPNRLGENATAPEQLERILAEATGHPVAGRAYTPEVSAG